MAIHKFTLLAEYEYDDENGEYPPYTPSQISVFLGGAMVTKVNWLGFTEKHFEVAAGDMKTAFGIDNLNPPTESQ